jgi:predicted nuclease of predicted toxin-antitoxin system
VKVKLDENLPATLADELTRLGHDVETVPQEGLAGRDDPSVWQSAQQDGRFLVTQDLDFSDVRKYRPGTHAGLLLVRLRAPGRKALLDRVLGLFRDEEVEAWKGCLVVTSETKLRIRSAPAP